MKKKTSKLAIASLGLGIVTPVFFAGMLISTNGFFAIPSLFLTILTIILGAIAWDKIRKAKGEFVGSEFALSGMIVGWLLVAVFLSMPIIRGELMVSNALKIGDNGTNIVLSIISGSSKREAMGLTPVWPSASADFSRKQKDYTKVPDSETYFTDLMDSKALPGLDWSVFAGAGVTAAKNRENFNKGNHNVWNVVAGLDKDAADDTPFLFTRNLNISVADLRDESMSLIDKLDHRIKPFGSERIVFIQKGGAMQTLQGVFLLNRAVFLRGAIFNSEINQNANVLKAKGMPE